MLHGNEMEVVDSFLALVAMALVKKQGLVKGSLTYTLAVARARHRILVKGYPNPNPNPN